MGERQRREQWVVDKTKEIKEQTVRGLEPDIQRLVGKQREEAQRLEAQIKEEARREVAAEQARSQRELARMNEAAAAERQAAVDHERELCQRRLSEMSSHVEHQLHDGRLRQAAQFAGEREAAEEARRREVSRLEADLRDARKKEAETASELASQRATLERDATERAAGDLAAAKAAHAAEKQAWESALEATVTARVDEARKEIAAESSRRRTKEIETVVARLGTEMAAKAKAAEERESRAHADAHSRFSDATRAAKEDAAEMRAKWMASVETAASLETKLRSATEELAKAQLQASSATAEAESAKHALCVEKAKVEQEAELRLSSVQGERVALSRQLAELRAEMVESHSKHEAALADARTRQEAELNHVEERVRAAMRRKDGAIQSLQRDLAAAHAALADTQQQLHATQQEILAME